MKNLWDIQTCFTSAHLRPPSPRMIRSASCSSSVCSWDTLKSIKEQVGCYRCLNHLCEQTKYRVLLCRHLSHFQCSKWFWIWLYQDWKFISEHLCISHKNKLISSSCEFSIAGWNSKCPEKTRWGIDHCRREFPRLPRLIASQRFWQSYWGNR